MDVIKWSDFEAIDLRIGTILQAEEFPEAKKPAYKVKVDLGPEIGTKNSSAQITKNYHLNELPGKQVICVVNFPPKQIGPYISEVLITGFPDEDNEVILAVPDKKVPNGNKLF